MADVTGSTAPVPLEARLSPKSMYLHLAGAIVFVASGVFILTKAGNEPLALLAGWSGIIFFGAVALIVVRQLTTLRGPVVCVNQHGLRDNRIANALIPWSRIEDISTWQWQGQKCIIVKVAPDLESTLPLGFAARLARPLNKWLGADGLAIIMNGLTVSHSQLMDAINAFRGQARNV